MDNDTSAETFTDAEYDNANALVRQLREALQLSPTARKAFDRVITDYAVRHCLSPADLLARVREAHFLPPLSDEADNDGGNNLKNRIANWIGEERIVELEERDLQDAWKQEKDIHDRFTKEWRVRWDMMVTALGCDRSVQLAVYERDPHQDAMALPGDPPIGRLVWSKERNVHTMRELGQALIAAADFVEMVNPEWASRHVDRGPHTVTRLDDQAAEMAKFFFDGNASVTIATSEERRRQVEGDEG